MMNILCIITETPLFLTTFYIHFFVETREFTSQRPQSFASNFPSEASLISFIYVISLQVSNFMQVALFFVNIKYNKIFRNEVKAICFKNVHKKRESNDRNRIELRRMTTKNTDVSNKFLEKKSEL